MVNTLYPAGHLRYGMEVRYKNHALIRPVPPLTYFVSGPFPLCFFRRWFSYQRRCVCAHPASKLLRSGLQFLRPKFMPLLCDTQQRNIVVTVEHLISVLGSSDVALDCRHTPAIYSKFLLNQLNRYRPSEASVYRPDSNWEMGDLEFVPQYHQTREQSPPNAYLHSWPDSDANFPAGSPGSSTPGSDHYSGVVYQRHGEAEIDFSINHFVATVSGSPPSGQSNFQTNYSSTSTLTGWDQEPQVRGTFPAPYHEHSQYARYGR